MSTRQPTIAYLTSGAAGMFCGSCMHDNTLAAALLRQGCDVHLIPTYTPIRTDEEDVSEPRIFFGGINVYLQERFLLFRWLPRFMDRWLDQPWLINAVAGKGISIDAAQLGSMTLSMLNGEAGHLRKEVHRLLDWLVNHVRPELVVTTNILIAGFAPALQRTLRMPLLVTLQGDDIFLNDLVEPYRDRVFERIRRLDESINGYIVASNYYADHMSSYLRLPREKFHVVPLGLRVERFLQSGVERRRPTDPDRPLVIGYLARVCPAKGLHQLVDAVARLRTMPGTSNVRILSAGWLGTSDQAYFDRVQQAVRSQGIGGDFEYRGAIDGPGKLNFLQEIDLFCVPTTYRDPKGLFVLEAVAAGAPVVQPDHGAFPELLARTGGGRLFRHGDLDHLAQSLHELCSNADLRRRLGEEGRQRVEAECTDTLMATRTLDVFRRFLPTT